MSKCNCGKTNITKHGVTPIKNNVGNVSKHVRKELLKLRDYISEASMDEFNMVTMRHDIAGPLATLSRALGFKTIRVR